MSRILTPTPATSAVPPPQSYKTAFSSVLSPDPLRSPSERGRPTTPPLKSPVPIPVSPSKTSTSTSAPAPAAATVTAATSAMPFTVTPAPGSELGLDDWESAKVYLSLGTNLAPTVCASKSRVVNLSLAVDRLKAMEGIVDVGEVSGVYQGDAMYVDGPGYLNACCSITTTLSPLALLAALKTIERDLGRNTQFQDKRPRTIDLDILCYGDGRKVNEEELVVPHVGMAEREFVLRPLADIAPDLIHPVERVSIKTMLARLTQPVVTDLLTSSISSLSRSPTLKPYFGIPSLPLTPTSTKCTTELDLSAKTHIMGIINVTPDSFSDGGDKLDVIDAVSAALQAVQDGAGVLDVGGYSTRPGADAVSEEEELNRVIPVIEGLRAEGCDAHISIDTFRAAVARKAVAAGATIINDVTAGRGDPEMLATAAELGCPIVLMHSRGDPGTMGSLTKYGKEGVVKGVKRELEERVGEALAKGIKRWNIILDPGIGFAKDTKGNLELLKNFGKITKPPRHTRITATGEELEDTHSSLGLLDPHPVSLSGLPMLIGASRKGFLGKILDQDDPKERIMGDAAWCVAAVAGGAGMVRLHDVRRLEEVVRVADAIYRGVEDDGEE